MTRLWHKGAESGKALTEKACIVVAVLPHVSKSDSHSR